MKTSAIAILLLFICAGAWALTTIGIGNDTWSLGLSENDDDLLTWSFNVTEQIQNVVAEVGIRAFTERGAVSNGRYFKERYDIFDVRAGSAFRFSIPEVDFSLQWRLGISITDNFGGEMFQNLLHKTIKLRSLELEYTKAKAAPSLLLSGSATHWFTENISTQVLLALEQRSTIGGIYGRAMLRLSTTGLLGYAGLDGAFWKGTQTLTSGLYAQAVSGLGMAYGFDLGFIVFDYRVNVLTRRGYGYIAIRPENMVRKTWNDTGWSLRFGKKSMTGGIGFGWERLSKDVLWFEVVLAQEYSSGYPDKGEGITDHYRMRRNYGIWQAGVGYALAFPIGVIRFNLLAGASRWTIDRMTNVDPENPLGSKRVAFRWFPAISAECDVAFLPEGFLVFGNASVSVDLLAGVSVFPGGLSRFLKADLMHGNWNEEHWLFPYVGIGIGFGI